MNNVIANMRWRARMTSVSRRRNSEAGVTMIETMMAGFILIVGSLSMIVLIINSIASNNRNKIDSTQTMLASAILEQINSTFITSGASSLVDCTGTSWTINTGFPSTGAGAALSGNSIDWTQTSPPAGYHMDYVVRTPCTSTGAIQGTYDVRWHVDIVGGAGVTNTFLLTVGAKLKNHGENNKYFSAPVTLRMMSGN
jgi:Tfp pilus assembly protein PilV